jgi:hypothetical protein
MEETKLEITKIEVTLAGLSDLLFDRFIDHSAEKRPPEQKLYLAKGNALMLPGANIESFLFRQLAPVGCALAFEGKQGKHYRAVGAAHVLVDQSLIPVMHVEKPAVFKAFGEDGFYIVNGAPITKSSGGAVIKQENNPRPCLALPWSISFSITLVRNTLINETKLFNWFAAGGVQIALGNWRPRYGRFEVTKWESHP